jgi:hypothetical protein
MRKGGLALVVILVLGSLTKLMIPQSSSSPAGPESRGAGTPANVAPGSQGTSPTKATTPIDWYPTKLREKIRDFFGAERGPELDPYEGKTNQKGKGGAGDAVGIRQLCESMDNWCVPPSSRNKIHFVIAATPDPVHSHLGLFFDRSIDAIQQGAKSRLFQFDRAIMPWPYFDLPASQITGEDKLLQRVRESYPGLMIFRKANADPLFIFVVGETPTAGINKEQFYTAIDMVHEIREGKDYVKPEQTVDFGVLGPSFSGSLYSLNEIFQHYLKTPGNHAPVLPVNAVVMGTDAIKDFADSKPPQVQIAIFMEDGKAVLDALFKYTGDLGYRRSDVAVLNEDDTAYGSSLSSASPLPAPQDNYLTLSFPRGIYQFRSAYSKDLQNQDQAADATQQQRRNLRLDLEVTGSDDDNVAPYASAQTALSQEAIMLALVSELRRNESKFILIRATNPLDELFLVRYLSSEYPNARLVVPSPDLFFARDEGGLVDGVMGLNTYPVSPPDLNPLCPPKGGGLNIFPAASSTGLYNATVALLGGPLEEGQPAAKDNATSGAAAPPSACALSPNLWLTIVSRNRFYPIKVIPFIDTSSSPSPTSPPKSSRFFPYSDGMRNEEYTKRSGRIPAPWAILCILCLVLLANHVRCSWKPTTQGDWQTANQLSDPGLSTWGKSWILWIGAVALVWMTVVFISSLTPWTGSGDDIGTLSAAILIWIFLIGFTVFVSLDFYVARKERTLAGLFFFIAVCFTWAGKAYAHESSYGNLTQMVLWQQRTIDLASHVSPATPLLLLLAAFYAWFWFSLKSESLTDWRRPLLPHFQDLPDAYGQLSEKVAQRILKVLHTFGPPRWVLGGAISLVALLAVRGGITGPGKVPIRSLEGTPFDILYSVLLGLALLLLIGTLLRIAAVWWKLQAVLMALDRPGMRQALQRLKGFEWDVIWNPLESMWDEARRLYLKEMHVVERLQESLTGAGNTTKPGEVEALKKECGEILAIRQEIYTLMAAGTLAEPKNAKKFIESVKDMQEKLAHTAGVLCKDFLDASWKALPADDGIEVSRVQPQDSSGTMKVNAAITNAADSLRNTLVNAEIKKADDPPPSGLADKSLRLAEEFVACFYSTFITIVLLRIRWLVFSSVVIYTGVVFSTTSYPFQPAAGLRTLALFLFLLSAMVVGYVYEEMHHDPTLRGMTSTDPNKVDAAFWLKLISAGLLPLLGLLTALFPQVGHFLYTIAAPILHATR